MATLTPRHDVAAPIEPIDLSRPELWKENRFAP